MKLFLEDGSLDLGVYSDLGMYLMSVGCEYGEKREYALSVQGVSMEQWELAGDVYEEQVY